MTVEQFPDRTITIDGKAYLYFGGTSYLGMATHPKFQRILSKSIKTWGTAYGSSRNANIKLGIYQKAENLLSRIVGAEAALTVSSGTMAGKFVIDYLEKTHERFYHYPKTHPAILKSSSLPLFVDGQLHPKLLDSQKESIVITADALLSLEVKPTNFDFLDDISSSKSITLLIDESHSLGIVGERGEGVFKTTNHQKIKQKIMIASLTKAIGCSGGVIAGNQQLIEAIRNDAVFISASGMNPIFLQSFFDSQELLEAQLIRLRQNLHYLYDRSDFGSQFNYDINYPVIYCYGTNVFGYLKAKDIIITNFKYPNYDTAMNRIVITANHTKNDLDQLKTALMQFQKEALH